MLLLIDIGNTSIKIGMARDNEIQCAYTLPTDYTSQSADSLGLKLQALCEHSKLAGHVKGCMISSVVPGMDPLMRRACERYLEVTPRFAHQEVPVPLENHYERPENVGADRLVAAFGARRMYPEATSIICADYGTATTFDCISADAYLGGLICPGILSSLGALARGTALLPNIALAPSDDLIVGRDTVTSLNHGFLFGFGAMTEGLCTRLARGLPGPVMTIGTGGFARVMQNVTNCIDAVHPDLILEGLRLLHMEQSD